MNHALYRQLIDTTSIMSSMNGGFDMYNIYSNIFGLLEFQNIPQPAKMERKDVLAALASSEYINIIANKPANEYRPQAIAVFVLIAKNSKYSSQLASFAKRLAECLALRPKDSTQQIDMMFIVDPSSLHDGRPSNFIAGAIAEFVRSNKNVTVDFRSYAPFVINFSKSSMCIGHSIASKAELEELSTRWHIQKESMPKILKSDTMAIWVGAQPGMVVRIDAPSEVAGYAVRYRYCING